LAAEKILKIDFTWKAWGGPFLKSATGLNWYTTE
jgi:hypothetical protein